ncbi:TPA: hypothetical protein ACHFYQ_002574 [Citrobacter freundii]|uniref:hypothetical protein n=1 Tax=Citrobacter TaxID=544 RepID=UPI001362C1FB|nr:MULTISPECIES: hypothetical protein [Citrobacter]QHI83277.1 hypothetical protein GUC46_13575 [Citrobacter sp. LUTT5]HAV1441450.1 hypothetical protein [Enterobacter hormaechei subsp. xiangfangensis]
MAIGWPALISGIAYVSGLQTVHPLASTSRISLRIHPIPKHSSYCRGIYPRPARAFPLFPNSKKSLTL